MLRDPQDAHDPEAIYCPHPDCEGGEVFTQQAFGIRRAKGFQRFCPVCDGGPVMTGNAMWDAMAWAERRGLSVIDATEELSR